MSRRLILIIALSALIAGSLAFAEDRYPVPDNTTDTYQIDFGPLMETFPGQTQVFVPIYIHITQPTVGVNILLSYDPTLLTPVHIAPNMFFQDFTVDNSIPGRIRINLYTNLPPPPAVPPIMGDTIFAWIDCEITSEDLGYDFLTHYSFYDDPNTPYPDNNILLEDGNWIVPPALSLLQADVLIISPLYGDINDNGYAFEIGDAITFLNYFMGEVEFTVRQYANSDCNRDGVQASIADLVYLLGVITGGVSSSPAVEPGVLSLPSYSDAKYHPGNNVLGLDADGSFSLNIECPRSLGGAYFVLDFDPRTIEIESVELNRSIDNLEFRWIEDDGKLMIAVYNSSGTASEFKNGDLFTVYYNGSSQFDNGSFRISRAEFSDTDGAVADASYNINFSDHYSLATPEKTGLSIMGYPNPFNGRITISYELPRDGSFDLVIFDILGREVKTLMNENKSSGGGAIVWDGSDNYGNDVSSGIYFARLRGETVSASLKLFLLK